MKIKLRNGKPASEEAFLEFEAAIGCVLSPSFKAFVQEHDGAKPETNIFKVTTSNDSGVNEFIPVNDILRERAHIENIPRFAYPVAWAEGGNYIFVDDGRNGAVFFWDHEMPEKPTWLAANLGAFLDLLEPFDIRTVQLKPGQVKKVWIDPEFLKKLNKP